jgi:hypothetical protein
MIVVSLPGQGLGGPRGGGEPRAVLGDAGGLSIAPADRRIRRMIHEEATHLSSPDQA